MREKKTKNNGWAKEGTIRNIDLLLVVSADTKAISELLNQFYSLQKHINIQNQEGHKEGHRRNHPLEMITSKKKKKICWAEQFGLKNWQDIDGEMEHLVLPQ